jgi:murein DD-endopeptidase MepM/ murein hydrolase activator NlpD
MSWIPINRYQIRQIKGYATVISIVLAAILFLGNVITALVKDRVTVGEGAYVVKDGFPLFTDEKEYIRMVKAYPHDPGVPLKIYRLANGESYWDVAYKNRISIDTLIAANPFITSLIPQNDIELVVPASDGVLMALNDLLDVLRMKLLLDSTADVAGDYLPGPFTLISTDDIRLVFFKGVKPVVTNDAIERLYRIKNIFQSPVTGNFTSFFGDRVHPFVQDGAVRYHNGIDIISHFDAPIHPTRAGMVIFTGWRGGFGKTVIIQHHDGYTTLYGHLNSIAVAAGDWVTKKDMIGRVGSTGWSTGPHLHYTIMRHGQDLNPLYYIW